MHNSTNITRCDHDFSELLLALHSEPESEGVGMTTTEICNALGCSRPTAVKKIREALEAGRIRRVEKGKSVEGLNGRQQPVTTFVICDQQKPIFPEQATL